MGIEIRVVSVDLRPTYLNGRFYAGDVKVVKTHLTSKTLKPSGIKTGRIKVDKVTDKNKIFLKKRLGSIIGRHWARANSAPNKR